MKFGEILKIKDYEQSRNRSFEDQLKHILSINYEFRRNIISGKRQFRRYNPLPSEQSEWLAFTDDIFNTIWSNLRANDDFKKVTESDLRRVIESDYSISYDPIKDYFDSLPVWDGQTDHIKDLAMLVKAKPGQEGNWYLYLSRWFIAMVATMLGKDINHSCLILLGPQGCGKSTFFHNLGINNDLTYTGHIIPGDRDSKIMTAEKTLINLDELESSTREDWSFIKSLVTLPHITVRRPYAKHAEELTRLASFCGSANKLQLLGDLTGSRRWLCVEIDEINYLGLTDELKRNVYSQARELYYQRCKYWFDGDEINEIDKSNQVFCEVCHENEALQILFKPISSKSFTASYLTSTEILYELNKEFPTIRFGQKKLGNVLKNLGFERIKHDGLYKYAVERLNG